MSKKNEIQKLSKVDKILELDEITKDSYKHLNEDEKSELFERITELANTLTGTERDEHIRKVDPITSQYTRNIIWENNHTRISGTINSLIQDYNRMPTQEEIARESGLSRNTVSKHLQEFKTNSIYIEQQEQYQIATETILARLYKFALNGDIKAAKLFLEMTGNTDKTNTNIQNQNNYIQINGITISQETVKQLKPQQIKGIEKILNQETQHLKSNN